jgi:DNA topoisomerase I
MAKKATKSGKSLMIVESPAKAKTIEKFLDNEFIVKSCYGHIRDLPKKDTAIDVKNHFEPTYEISPDKKEVVNELKKLSKSAKEVWLATDEDREGEAISWHLSQALGLDVNKAKRIVFHEITKPAIKEAVKNPRKIDLNLVNAQQARRILDRLVGFELSPILWKKIARSTSLSAGRVQSVAVRLIVEREREINNFKVESYFKVSAYFTGKDKNGNTLVFKADLPKNKTTLAEAEAFLRSCIGADYIVKDIQVKPGKKSPAAPFTTSTLQQEASRKLGFSVARTMLIAQRLYEAGKISYMRTDSTNLSESALEVISKEITANYGKRYLQNRKFTSKSANAQEAHEAIRPSYIENKEIDGEVDEQKLYNLIWKRTIASQMSDAELERTVAKIEISTNKEELAASGEVILFDGFLKVYMESTDEDGQEDTTSDMLPVLIVGEKQSLKEMVSTERFTRPAARYTEAALVKKLEELGIGRPSTYAPTISTIQKRTYVEKKEREGVERRFAVLRLKENTFTKEEAKELTGAEKGKLFPTDQGMLVNDFLMEHFNNVMDYGFTAEIEKEFDDIAEGNKKWQEMINDFYKPFHKDVKKTMETAERVTGERLLGVDPASGKNVIVRMGRFGPLAQIGIANPETEEKPRFAGLMPGMSMESLTLEQALELFKFPKKIGEYKGSDVAVSQGRFGPYVAYNKKFYSLKKGTNPLEVSLQDAVVLIEEKAQNIIKEFKESGVTVLNGKWGPYVKSGKLNAKIPKDLEPASLTLEQCMELLEIARAAPPRRGRFRPRAKS